MARGAAPRGTMIPMATSAEVSGLLMNDNAVVVLFVLVDEMLVLVGTTIGIVEVVVVMWVYLMKVVVAEGARETLSVGLRGTLKEIVSVTVTGVVSLMIGGKTPGASGPSKMGFTDVMLDVTEEVVEVLLRAAAPKTTLLTLVLPQTSERNRCRYQQCYDTPFVRLLFVYVSTLRRGG